MTQQYKALPVLAALALLTALSGCASSAAADGNGVTASTSSSPEVKVPTTLVVTASALEVHSDSGSVLTTMRYVDAVDKVVAELGEALGAEPTVTDDAATAEKVYSWPGIVLRAPEAGGKGTLSAPSFHVTVSAAELGGLAAETQQGIAIGDPATADSKIGSVAAGTDANGAALSVGVLAKIGSAGTVAEIDAPVLN